jgi:hypothetical protein
VNLLKIIQFELIQSSLPKQNDHLFSDLSLKDIFSKLG